MAKRAPKKTVPVPVKTEGRNCFGLAWFKTEADAKAYAKTVKGQSYNGGWFDGKACGREAAFDYLDAQLGPLFAVSTR